jgi:hypothetical protein
MHMLQCLLSLVEVVFIPVENRTFLII